MKGDGPTSIAAGFGSVWIGLGNGHVVRIDAGSGREQARLRAHPTAFVHGIVAAYGAVWAVRSSVVRIDPRANVVREVGRVGSATLFNIQAGAGALWLPDDGANEIIRVDPKSAALVARIRVPGRAFGVWAGRSDVLVLTVPGKGPVTGPAGSWPIRRLDPRTNRLSRPLVRLRCHPGLTIGRAAVWTVDECRGLLVRRDPRTLRPTGLLSLPRRWSVPVLGFGSLWIAGGRRLYRIDPESLRVHASIKLRCSAAAVGAHALWVLDSGDGTHGAVTKIDPRTNRIVSRFEVATEP